MTERSFLCQLSTVICHPSTIMYKSFWLIIFTCFALPGRAQNAELRFLEHLTENRSPGMTRFMQGVSNTTNIISLAAPAGLFVAGAIHHDHVMQQKSWYVVETIAVGSGIAIVMKYVVNRPRPSSKDSLIIPAGDMGSPSFPSGHTSMAFATATALSLAYPKWYVIAPSFLWAGTVGFSRMYLGVHYPTDVLAGAIVGSGSALLCRKINQWIFQAKVRKVIWY
jgi:membrane-associated phospholipid phosphatase